MNFLDLALLVIIFFYAWSGLWMGVIRKVGGLIAVIIGASLATRYYDKTAELVKLLFFENENLANVGGFIIILIFTYLFISFILMKTVPAGMPYNHLLGLIIGALEGLLVAGVILFFLARFPFWPPLDDLLKTSFLSPYISRVTYIIWPLLPDVIKKLKGAT